jgi:hypothetical protein
MGCPEFSILEPLRESFFAVYFAQRVFQHPVRAAIGALEKSYNIATMPSTEGNRKVAAVASNGVK